MLEPVDKNTQPELKVDIVMVRVIPGCLSHTETEMLLGGHSKAKEKLNWVSEISVQEYVKK